jgi:succinyl-CoA synthetase beta subunit
MARKRITEFIAKKILYPSLKIEMDKASLNIDSLKDSLSILPESKNYVVKVDQGVKKRMKRGFVKVNISKSDVTEYIDELSTQGFTNFFIEEYVEHSSEDEKYLSMERTREGVLVLYSNKGGINVEEHVEKIQKK